MILKLEIEINSDINFVKSIDIDLRNIFQIKLHPGDGLFHNFETKKDGKKILRT